MCNYFCFILCTCSTSGHVQKSSSLATNSDVEHYLRQKCGMGSPEIPSSIAEEVDPDLVKESVIEYQPSQHAVVDAKEAMVTGTSLHHSFYVQLSNLATIATGSNISAGTHAHSACMHTHANTRMYILILG